MAGKTFYSLIASLSQLFNLICSLLSESETLLSKSLFVWINSTKQFFNLCGDAVELNPRWFRKIIPEIILKNAAELTLLSPDKN